MKIFDKNPFSCTTFLLIFFIASCGGDHAGDNHSGSSYDTNSHAPMSQENLLTMLEATDSPHGETSVHAPIASKQETAESAVYVASSVANDLEALLGGDLPVQGEPAHGAGRPDHEQLEPMTSATHSEATGLLSLQEKAHEDLLSTLNHSKLALEEQVDTLTRRLKERDRTINSLKLINQKLRDELNRLRETSPRASANLPINGEIQVLRDELLRLKNTFTLKVKELDELRLYNKELLGRLDNLEPAAKRNLVSPPTANVNPTRKSTNVATPDDALGKLLPDLPIVAPPHSSGKVLIPSSPPTGSLEFDAVVTAANGKIKEAFYTEFFIAKYDLRGILEKAGINLDNPKYKNITSHAELWAQSRKYPFRYPDLQKDIRKALLDSIDDEKSSGRRIRTDIDGNSGEIRSLAAGSYYIIGTASLGQVGVTWSVPVKVKSGRNKVSLTIANASWSL